MRTPGYRLGSAPRLGLGLAMLGLSATLVIAAAAWAAPSSSAPSIAQARLTGKFALLATVTVARDIPGERAGQRFLRTWSFTSPCASGACSKAILSRQRSHGTDRLTLKRRAPGYYTGSSSFYAAARCGSRTYSKGILVPFRIAVRVTAAALNAAGADIATRLRAEYTNATRTNLTPCVAALGHDAAKYHGHLM